MAVHISVLNLLLFGVQVMTDVAGNPEEERHADFYHQTWAQEAVCRYFYGKVSIFLTSSTGHYP